MDTRAIETEDDYRAVLAEIERLFGAVPGTPQGERLEALVTLVEVYEERHYRIPEPDAAEFGSG